MIKSKCLLFSYRKETGPEEKREKDKKAWVEWLEIYR